MYAENENYKKWGYTKHKFDKKLRGIVIETTNSFFTTITKNGTRDHEIDIQ